MRFLFDQNISHRILKLISKDYSREINKFINNSKYGCFEIFRFRSK